MTSSNFIDTAPPSVKESADPKTVIDWINTLPLHEHTGKALLNEWATRNNVKLTAAHYAQVQNPMGGILRANLSRLSRP